MNYRHAYHAGNHADVLKHWVLTRCIALLQKKPAPVAYVDTHAGIGLYDLQGEEAVKTAEWQEGIARIWASPHPLLAEYLHAVRELNDDDELRYYPGSPELARCLTRSQDHLYLNEKHPEDGQLLKENMRIDRRVSVHIGEGWYVPRALLPTGEKRVLMLMKVMSCRSARKRLRKPWHVCARRLCVFGIRLKILPNYARFTTACNAVVLLNCCVLSYTWTSLVTPAV